MSGNDDDEFVVEDVAKNQPSKPVTSQPGVELDEDGRPIMKPRKKELTEEDKKA